MGKDTFLPGEFAGLTEVEIERQSAVATGKDWLFAKQNDLQEDSRQLLEGKGLKIVGEKNLFYQVEPPEGWHRETEGYHTNILNDKGETILRQFCKLAPHDSRANISAVAPKK